MLSQIYHQLITHRRQGAEHADLRIVMTDEHHMLTLHEATVRNYAVRDPKHPLRLKEVMGVEVITAEIGTHLDMPLVMRLAST